MAGGKAFCPFSMALFAGSAFSYIAYLRQKKQATLPKRCIDVHKQTYIIAGDIGGTNSRFALHLSGQKDPLLVHVYSNEDSLKKTTTTFHHATLKPFLQKCLAEVEAWKALGEKEVLSKIQVVACLATAGPVTMDNDVFMVNLGESGGSIDGNEIEKCQDGLLSLVVRCKLVNDFVGQGYGVLDLDLDKEVIELLPGSKAKVKDLGPICCVGAGTGLGECFLTKSSLATKLGYECYPSEGGHSDFTPRGPLEVELVDYLKEKFSCDYRVSVERIVSGRGLANVYEFLANKFPDRVDTLVHEEFLAAGDQQGRVGEFRNEIVNKKYVVSDCFVQPSANCAVWCTV